MAPPLHHRRRPAQDSNQNQRVYWHSRLALLIAMVLLPLAGVMIYVGPSWPTVLWRLLVDGGMTVLWLAGACGLGLGILRLLGMWKADTPRTKTSAGTPVILRYSEGSGSPVGSARSFGAPQDDASCVSESCTLLTWILAAAVGLGIFSLTILGLGLIGCLNAITSWGMLAAGWIVGAICLREMIGTGGLSLRNSLAKSAGWAWLWLIATPFLVLAITAAMAPPGMLWTPEEPHGYDVVEYHLQIPREWYEAHRIIPLHHNVFSFFPFNVEMHYLLAMHLRGGPWAGMYLAQLMHFSFFLLMIAAVYGLARRFANAASATIAALALLTVPWITQLSAIAYDEGGFLLFGILAIGIAISAAFEANQRLKRFALAGVMAGFAAGSKLTGVPEVMAAVPVVLGIVGVWIFFRRNLPRPQDIGGPPTPRNFWLGIILFGVTALLTFSPWLIRNVAWAGNPVFPEMTRMLGHGDFTPVQVERFERAHKPPPVQQSFAARIKALNREVLCWWPFGDSSNASSSAWQFGYLIVPFGLVAFALSARRPESWCLLGLLLILTLFWLLMTHLQSRFFILAAPIAALLIARIDWGRGAIAGVVLICIFAAMGWLQTNARLEAKLYGSSTNNSGIVAAMGMDGVSLFEQITPMELPKTGSIILVGDARAFYYTIPMSRLRYRTVFDVKENADIVQAWIGKETPADGGSILINPSELRRFHDTYFGLPPIPPAVESAREPFIVKR